MITGQWSENRFTPRECINRGIMRVHFWSDPQVREEMLPCPWEGAQAASASAEASHRAEKTERRARKNF